MGSPAAGACHDPREGAAQRPPVSGGAPSPDEQRCPVLPDERRPRARVPAAAASGEGAHGGSP